MNKIKIVGALVFILSSILAFISVSIANKNRADITTLSSLSQQKELVQEVSKSIFYSYRNGITDFTTFKKLEKDNFISSNIEELWRDFSLDVQKFRRQQQVATGYNSIITAKLVNNIYHKNVLLIKEFNSVIELKKLEMNSKIEASKLLQKSLFFLLIVLLFYLFTQLHFVLDFIERFSTVSEKIRENSTIQGVESINVKTTTQELKEATDSYNYMVEKMNLSILESSQSMDKSIKSLEEVAQNIENFMELLSTMNPQESDAFFKKEDAVIDSLEILMSLRKRLKHLKIELEKLS